MKKKINIIIQARLSSSRLKKKIILKINKKPMIFYIIERLRKVKGINKIILSTSQYKKNLKLIEYVKKENVDVYYENNKNENDICSRLFNTCKEFPCDAFVKINGDCPVPEINIINRMVSIYNDEFGVDYISNKKDQWPLGYSAEIISLNSLKWCNENFRELEDREVFATHLSSLNDKFKIIFLPNKIKFKYSYHMMIDTIHDFEIIKKVFLNIYKKKKYFNFRDVENYFKSIDQNLNDNK